MKVSVVNLQNYNRNPKLTFTGTSNAIAKGVEKVCESKFATKKTAYSALGVLLVGTLGYLVLKPENEAIKHASNCIPKN